MEEEIEIQCWIKWMNEADFDFIRDFLIASGSLKKIAEECKISYPTIRQRLNRLIKKINLYGDEMKTDLFEIQLHVAHVDGKVDQTVFTELLNSYLLQKLEQSRHSLHNPQDEFCV